MLYILFCLSKNIFHRYVPDVKVKFLVTNLEAGTIWLLLFWTLQIQNWTATFYGHGKRKYRFIL